mmetsp:Transcript_4693/g.7508  ORF Transcript_4693/g.7508 Transcript_4693/m.7508 type:complete len:273 (+) Transcript_4693:53-871(+)
MESTRREWIISNLIKLVILFGHFGIVTMFLATPCSQTWKRTLHFGCILSSLLLIVLFLWIITEQIDWEVYAVLLISSACIQLAMGALILDSALMALYNIAVFHTKGGQLRNTQLNMRPLANALTTFAFLLIIGNIVALAGLLITNEVRWNAFRLLIASPLFLAGGVIAAASLSRLLLIVKESHDQIKESTSGPLSRSNLKQTANWTPKVSRSRLREPQKTQDAHSGEAQSLKPTVSVRSSTDKVTDMKLMDQFHLELPSQSPAVRVHLERMW